MTLVEVLASMVLISTLLVGGFRALEQHLEQHRRSQLKSHAVLAADQLLTTWFSEQENRVLVAGGGMTSHIDAFRWETKVVSASPEAGLVVVRLQLFAVELKDFNLPIASVDVAVGLANLVEGS